MMHALVRFCDAPVGELISPSRSCIGIDIQAVGIAPNGELVRVNYSSNNEMSLALQVAFDFLGAIEPSIIGCGERICVLHNPEDFSVILAEIPRNADCPSLFGDHVFSL
jgi:hypothetical protein